jgi:hypothetical protein
MTNHAGRLFVAIAALSFAGFAGAQTLPTGQAPPPGTQNKTNSSQPCANADPTGMPTTQAQVDANCTPLGPGFAVPSTNMPEDKGHHVVAVVRVESVIEKPATLPFPMEFHTVGNSTMVKARLPRVQSCFAAGRVWSNRTGVATSTTCLDHKGEVIAYQECKPKVGDTAGTCSNVMAKDDGDAVALVK